MNVSLVRNIPQGQFEEVSVLMDGWQDKFQSLVSQNRPVRFDRFPSKTVPPELQEFFKQEGYDVLVPENDRWVHFLVPSA